VYLRIAKGEFPKPVSLGARAVGWIETEVEDWIAHQIKVSREFEAQWATLTRSLSTQKKRRCDNLGVLWELSFCLKLRLWREGGIPITSLKH
jgi:hypothetical protein